MSYILSHHEIIFIVHTTLTCRIIYILQFHFLAIWQPQSLVGRRWRRTFCEGGDALLPSGIFFFDFGEALKPSKAALLELGIDCAERERRFPSMAATKKANFLGKASDKSKAREKKARSGSARARSAAINAFFRAPQRGGQVSALAVLATALESQGRGRDMISSCRHICP